MAIEIQGLTRKQVALMDILWAMETHEQVSKFVRSLPQRDAQDCQSLIEIAVQESLEQDGNLAEFATSALELINKVRT